MRRIIVVFIAGILSISLLACKSSDYKKAIELQETGDYVGALAIYTELGDYEDAATRIQECQNSIDYNDAIDLQNKGDYAGAAAIYEKISGFKDTDTLLEECQNYITYEEAVSQQESQEYEAALANFEAISGFQDADDRAKECQSIINALDALDIAITYLEEQNSILDQAISEANDVVMSEEKALDESLRPAVETAISEAKAVKINLPEIPEDADSINSLAEELNKTDYTAQLDNLSEKKKELECSIKQYALVNAPEEAYVIKVLQKIPGVIDIAAATEENDPNGNMNKAGGYTAAVYFSYDKVDQSATFGDTLIEKGTEAGGQIEVYPTEEDAVRRNDYLAGFDGSIFASGSHTVIGTVVVRTSDLLTASAQKELEANIIDELIKLDE